jgi:hypothetical protein
MSDSFKKFLSRLIKMRIQPTLTEQAFTALNEIDKMERYVNDNNLVDCEDWEELHQSIKKI